MTDFTPGAIITRDNPLWDGDRPSWLRDDVRILIRDAEDGFWYGEVEKGAFPFYSRNIDAYDDAIRLDASDIVYRCIAWNEAHPDEPVMWPWYGGDDAPADVGERILFKDGEDAAGDGCWDWKNFDGDCCIIGYQRRPTTSLPEPAEKLKILVDDAWLQKRIDEDPDVEISAGADIHTSGYAEVVEESPEDFARAACERAGMVAVPKMTEREAHKLWGYSDDTKHTFAFRLKHLGIIRPDPSPLDLAKAAHPNISPEIVESTAAIVTKGEAK